MAKQNGFFMVSNRIFDFGLTPRTLAVYCCLLKHKSHTTNDCWPSRETMARLCRCTRRTVDKALHELCDIGLVKKEERYAADGRRISNLYTVCDLLPERCPVQDTTPGYCFGLLINKTHQNQTHPKIRYNRKRTGEGYGKINGN